MLLFQFQNAMHCRRVQLYLRRGERGILARHDSVPDFIERQCHGFR